MKKQLAIVLLLVFALSACLSLAACNTEAAEKAIKMYQCEQEGLVVSDTFTLPANIGDYKTKWSSSHPDVIKVESHKKADWTATIIRPVDGDEVAVTLTLKLSGLTRDFVMYVKPIDVYDFQDNYAFPYEKASLTGDIDLETSCKFQDQTATITWSVHEDSANYIAINDAGNKCIVTAPGDEDKIVQIKATFTYKNVSTTKVYRMTVIKPVTHIEEVHKWYTNTGVASTLSGWIVEVGTVYSSQYKNITLYMIDENLDAGYYVYRGKTADDATGAKLVPGAFVTLTGSTNTLYSGLYETNGNGTFTVDDEKFDLTKAQTAYAIDNDLLAGVPSYIYHTSRYVTLTDWKVKKVETKLTKYDNATLFTVTKGGVDVAIRVSKYMEGSYASANDQEWKDLVALQDTLKVDDVVSLKGILGNYNGAQISLVKASDVTKSTGDGDATNTPGAKIKAAVKQVTDALNSKLSDQITSATTITLPASKTDGVTLNYSLVTEGRATKIENGKLVVTPGLAESVTLRVDVTCGEDYSTYILYTVKSRQASAQEQVDTELEALVDAIDIKYARSETLRTAGKTFTGVTIDWAIKETTTVAKIEGGKVVVESLPAAETVLTLVATVKDADEAVTETKEITLTVGAAQVPVSGKVKINFALLAGTGTGLTDGDNGKEAATTLFKAVMDCNADKLTSVVLTKVYDGNGTGGAFVNSAGFLKLGTGSANGKIVLTFADTLKFSKVEIKCHDWYTKNDDNPTNNNQVAINGSTKQLATYSTDATPGVLTFDLTTATNEITLETSNSKSGGGRVFLFEMVLTIAED